MIIMEQKLMRNLMRAAGTARRRTEGDGAHTGHHSRGFGHILDLLDKDGISQQQIADTLGIRPQSVSEAVTVLESRGYVCRIPSATDKRKLLICITDTGAEHRQELAQRRKVHAQQFFAALNQEEKAQLLTLLEKLNSHHSDKENV
ncbi:MAG: MarR family transcriptional regulator [Oscillospiraceae bacterium]|nr:MarR family transcriptional regulator [Oscillospiraceae bacterium]